jgi:hypothetical protein
MSSGGRGDSAVAAADRRRAERRDTARVADLALPELRRLVVTPR